jgi:ribonucleoside-diphosphate reductase alpha chain
MKTIIKRNGASEPFTADKFNAAIRHACDGLSGVSVSDVAMNCSLQFYDGITTTEIDKMIIKSGIDLISLEAPNYQFFVAKYAMMNLRKEVYGKFEPPPLKEIVKTNVALGAYTEELLNWYTDEDFNQLEKIIRHKRDFDFSYAAVEQLIGKYLVQDRSTGKIFETPQVAYLMIAATIKGKYPKETRLAEIKSFYEAISKHQISLPTPIMAGVRTSTKQFSSCVLIETDDTLDSINASTSAIVKYVSKRAGIGLGVGSIRAIGSKVKKGEVVHTGVTPFYKMFQAAVKSCSQGGVRGGAMTVSVPFWHYEIQDILVLKNSKGTEENRVRRIDYCIQFNTYLIRRAIEKKSISLFSPHEVPGLYDAFFGQTPDEFIRLYEKYENDDSIRKKTVDAMELIMEFISERSETARIYSSLVDEVNKRSPFLLPVKMTNLCAEVLLTTSPLRHIDDDGTDLVEVQVPKERISEFFEWRKSQGKTIESLV